MGEEQREILKMVADKIITVEEAERLLRALEEGTRAQHAEPRRERSGVGVAFEALGDVLSDIGPTVKHAVEDAMSGVGFGPDEPDDAGLERIAWEGAAIPVEAGTVLDVIQRRTGVRHGSSLTIEGVPGDACEIEGADATGIRVYRQEGRLHIRWAHGDLSVRVPQAVAKVSARVLGGNIRSKSTGCPVHLRTMGGNVELDDVTHPFDAKTMGGSIELTLCPEFHGAGRGHTMGGSLSACVPQGLSCAVHAVTMGGTIEVDGGMASVERSKAAGKQRVNVTLGPGPVAATLDLKTMGGSISVRRAHE